jgi:DNA-binding FadR family transcriptional regulator
MIIAQRIVGDIDRMSLRPGAKLPSERVMLEEYGVGRGTLRESLRFLELQGVLSLRPGPGGGPVVQRPDAGNLATTMVLLLQFADAPFRVIVEARSGLEPVMAYLAAQRISPEALERLDDSIQAMERSLADRTAFLEADKRFHDVIAWSSGNAMFGYVVDALLGIMDGTVRGIDYPRHRRSAILEAHRRIHAALRDQDAPGARAAMQEHIDEYLRYAERKYPDVLKQRVTWSTLTS